MIVRPANPADLDRCERLDGNYTTGHIWQVHTAVGQERINTTLRRVRTPRVIEVSYPGPPRDLYADWRRNECLLVASERATIFGYLDLTVERSDWQGWLLHLIVDRAVRRQGIGSMLLAAGTEWARGSELDSLSVSLQSRNDPAVQMLLKQGFRYRGSLDRYFDNGDAALIYTLYL